MARKLIVLAGLVCMLVLGTSAAFAKDVMKLPTCWMPEHETFIIWYAKEQGWDKEMGLDIELQYYDSGMAQMEALPAGQWVLGGTGGVPQMMGALRYGALQIGLGNDEAIANGVIVRPDSPILGVKGANPDAPEVFGSAELVKGKTILCTTISSAHFALSNWLKVLGLTDEDVIIKNMDQASIMAAYESGVGDIAVLWAPFLYQAIGKGWKVAGTPRSCGVGLPITLVADGKFAEKNPEVVAKFLKIFMRGIDYMKATPVEQIVPEYKRFFIEWSGLEFDDATAKMDIERHPVFTLDEQIALFDDSKGQSTAQVWQDNVASFFAGLGTITKEEFDKVKGAKYVTGKYLKMAKEM